MQHVERALWSLAIRLSIAIAAILMVVSTLDAGDLRFKRHVISDRTDYSAAALLDVNHDGLLDIVCGGDWYEAPTWKRHFLAEIPRIGGRPDGFSHLAFDVNRDGWVDVITVNFRSRSIKWMEHPGEELGPWKTHIAVEPGPMETGRLVDMDGDGQLDLLPNGARFAAWWEFRWNKAVGPSDPAWIRHDLPEEAGGHGLGFGDIDGDGRGDVAAQNGWLSAPSDPRHGKWEWHPDYRIERGSIPMIVIDADEDGDNDIVWCSAHGFGAYWLEQTHGADGKRDWHRHAIDTSWSQGHAPLWVDMDGDGRSELVAGKRYMSHAGKDPGAYDPIAAYRYQFNPATRTWDRWTLSSPGERVSLGLDPKVADMDGDGDLDLLASGRSGLYWLENLGPPTTSASASATAAPKYADHQDLMVVHEAGPTSEVQTPEDWGLRRMHIVTSIEDAHGALPGPESRVPLNVTVEKRDAGASFTTETIRYQVDPERHVAANLYLPNSAKAGETRGIVCMFSSQESGVANEIAAELAARGNACVVPQLVDADGADSILDCVWQTMRAADLLQGLDEVHGERIGLISNALNGRLGLYAGAIDQRFLAVVADTTKWQQGVTPLGDQYSLAEVIAATAPRALRILLPEDSNVSASLRRHQGNALSIFGLRKVPKNLVTSDPWSSAAERSNGYTWLETKIGG